MAENKRISLYLIIPIILQLVLIYYLARINQSLLSILLNLGVYLIFTLEFYINGWAEKFELLNVAQVVADRIKIGREVTLKFFFFVFLLVIVEVLIDKLFQIKLPFSSESMLLGVWSSVGINRSLNELPTVKEEPVRLKVSELPIEMRIILLLIFGGLLLLVLYFFLIGTEVI